MSFTRRKFLATGGAAAAAAAVSLPAFSNGDSVSQKNRSDIKFSLAMAGYTFAKINLEQALIIMQKVGVKFLAMKNFHLPLDSRQEVVDQTLLKMKSYGVEPYGVGPISMKTTADVDLAFSHAKSVGTDLIIAIPEYQVLPYIEKKLKEDNFFVAIHNHGPEQPKLASVEEIWEEIKNLDPRIGFCLDLAHTMRIGRDPYEAYIKVHERVYDLHVWDLDKPEKSGWCVEAGRGIIDFPKFFNILREYNYSGKCTLEYAKDMDDPLAGIAESIGYFRGVLAGLGTIS